MTLARPMPLGLVQQWGGGASAADLLDHRRTEEFAFYIGAPPGVTSDVETVAPPPAPPTVETCRRELEATRTAARRLELQLTGFQPPAAAFAAASASPALSARIQQAVDETLGAHQASAECRGPWCRLRFSTPPGAETLARLRPDERLRGSLLGARLVDGQVYMLMREDAFGVLRRLREPMHEAGFFAACPSPTAPGSVLLRLAVPATGDVNDQGAPGRASVRAIGGTLATAPATACLVQRLEALLDADLPAPINGALRLESWTWQPGAPPEMITPE